MSSNSGIFVAFLLLFLMMILLFGEASFSLSFQAHLNSQSSSLALMPLSSCSVSCHILFYLNYTNSLGQGLSQYLENAASRYSAA